MEHFIVQIGALMAAVAALVVLFRVARQSSILAYIVAGLAASLLGLHIPEEVVHAVSEIGIILLLFMAGLEVELRSLRRRWRLLLIIGLGQVLVNTALGALLGWAALDIEQVTTLIYFGLCLTFSSTIIVLGLLKTRRELDTLHGQVILGLMVIQDVTAVLALAALKAISTGAALGPALGMLLLKLLAMTALLVAAGRFLLRPLFRYLARSAELLFVGALGWALGVAALGEAFHFSPEISAFLAGVAMAILPYKLEIEDKVDPLKSFGVVLFFVSLGYGLELGPQTLGYLPPVLAVAALAVFGTLPLVLGLGWLGRLKSRPAFIIGGIINQISEFSLILATLCLQAGVFEQDHFMIITLACVVSIVLSTAGHQVLQPLYSAAAGLLEFLDAHARRPAGASERREGPFAVLIGHNELSQALTEHLHSRDRSVVLIDCDPEVHHSLAGRADRLHPLYADIYDPDTWEEAGFRDAELVISCRAGSQLAELAVLRWMKEHDIQVPFIAATDSSAEALELYEAGAAYVIQSDALAAERMREIFEQTEAHDLSDHGRSHRRCLEHQRRTTPDLFRFL